MTTDESDIRNAALEEGGWQPIETAPKDGSEIVAHDEATGTSHVTHWNQYGWHDPDSHYYSEAPDFAPTHWMPLPKPPEPTPAPKPFTFADPSAQLQHERHRAESRREK